MTQLKERAMRAAAAIVAEHDIDPAYLNREILLALLALTWVEGRQAGGDEAREVVAQYLAELRCAL